MNKYFIYMICEDKVKAEDTERINLANDNKNAKKYIMNE